METVEPGKYYQMGQKTFWLSIIQRVGPSLSLIILAFALLFFNGNGAFPDYSQIFISSIIVFLFILSTFLFVIALVVSQLEYRTSRVMMDDSSFHIVRGVLGKEEVSIPYRRIQSVEIKQSLLYRMLGVGHVVISTTTDLEQPTSQHEDESNDEVIKAMDYSLALLVEKTLTNRAEIERMEVKK